MSLIIEYNNRSCLQIIEHISCFTFFVLRQARLSIPQRVLKSHLSCLRLHLSLIRSWKLKIVISQRREYFFNLNLKDIFAHDIMIMGESDRRKNWARHNDLGLRKYYFCKLRVFWTNTNFLIWHYRSFFILNILKLSLSVFINSVNYNFLQFRLMLHNF